MTGTPLESPKTLAEVDQDGRRPFQIGDIIDVTVNGYDITGPVIDRNGRHLVLYNEVGSERWFLDWRFEVTAITVTEAPRTPEPEPDPGDPEE